jgi:hypothetical protein
MPFFSPGTPEVDYSDNHHIDAFGRLRVSEPVNLWTSTFQHNLHPLFFNETTANNGSVTHLPNESAAALAVATDNGSKAILQTFEYFQYQPGKSHTIAMTFVADSQQANTDVRIGYFDDDNGIFLELTGASTINLVRRTKTSGSVVNNKVAQASWNIDPFDGTGPSGVTIDLTLGQILWIDLQWLSLGRIRVGFDIDGVLFYAHQFLVANVLTVPSLTTGNLPVRWEIVNTGVASATKTLTAICSTVFSEGGASFELGHAFAGGNGATFRTGIGTTAIPIFSLRPATTFNSITNRIKVRLSNLDIFADDSMLWQIIYKPTSITDATFAVGPVAHSSVEVDIAGTAIVGGIIAASGYIAASNKGGLASAVDLGSKYPFFLDAAGTGQGNSFSVTVQTLGGTNKQAAGTANWTEIR